MSILKIILICAAVLGGIVLLLLAALGALLCLSVSAKVRHEQDARD